MLGLALGEIEGASVLSQHCRNVSEPSASVDGQHKPVVFSSARQRSCAPQCGSTVGEALGPCVRRALSIEEVRRATAVCHGVTLPWDCVLVDAWRALRCGDHFLYVAVRLL